jgi:hypothetical protein
LASAGKAGRFVLRLFPVGLETVMGTAIVTPGRDAAEIDAVSGLPAVLAGSAGPCSSLVLMIPLHMLIQEERYREPARQGEVLKARVE